jgi:hypothetical protein
VDPGFAAPNFPGHAPRPPAARQCCRAQNRRPCPKPRPSRFALKFKSPIMTRPALNGALSMRFVFTVSRYYPMQATGNHSRVMTPQSGRAGFQACRARTCRARANRLADMDPAAYLVDCKQLIVVRTYRSFTLVSYSPSKHKLCPKNSPRLPPPNHLERLRDSLPKK